MSAQADGNANKPVRLLVVTKDNLLAPMGEPTEAMIAEMKTKGLVHVDRVALSRGPCTRGAFLGELLEGLRARQWDVVVVESLCLVSRISANVLRLVGIAVDSDIRFIASAEGVDTKNAAWKLQVTLASLAATVGCLKPRRRMGGTRRTYRSL